MDDQPSASPVPAPMWDALLESFDGLRDTWEARWETTATQARHQVDRIDRAKRRFETWLEETEGFRVASPFSILVSEDFGEVPGIEGEAFTYGFTVHLETNISIRHRGKFDAYGPGLRLTNVADMKNPNKPWIGYRPGGVGNYGTAIEALRFALNMELPASEPLAPCDANPFHANDA